MDRASRETYRSCLSSDLPLFTPSGTSTSLKPFHTKLNRQKAKPRLRSHCSRSRFVFEITIQKLASLSLVVWVL
jgi:hypothetical protein